MRLGIQTDSLDKKTYGRFGGETYKKLAELGYSASDFNMSVTGQGLYTMPFEEAEAILQTEKALAEEAGVRIHQVHGPWTWPPPEMIGRKKERLEEMKYSIRLSAILGAPNWVVHPIMPYGVEEAGTETAKLTWEENIAFFSELAETAAEYGITVCLENMPFLDFSLSRPEAILQVVETVNHPNFKVCLDTGHVSVFDELDLAEETRRIGSLLRTMHVHDNIQGRDLHLWPFFGRLDWDAFAQALKDIGYDGVFSLETIPAYKLPDDLFEKEGRVLSDIAKRITADI